MRVATATAIALVIGATAGCLREPVHRCEQPADCTGGACVIAPGAADGLCAVDDAACEGGLRFADDAGDVAGTCVGAGAEPDANLCLLGGPRVAEDACTIGVCSALPRCCTDEWGDACRLEAERRCGARCGELAAFAGAELFVGRWNGTDFTTIWSTPVGDERIGGAAWGDLDGDGRPELATCSTLSDGSMERVHIYNNLGATWVEELDTAPIDIGIQCFDLSWVDLDGDGDLDLAFGGSGPGAWLRNDAGVWAAPEEFTEGLTPQLDFADLDGDGRPEIAAARYDATTLVLDNLPTGFPELSSLARPELPKGAVAHWEAVSFGDLDGDGAADVLASGDGVAVVVRNAAPAGGFAFGAPLLTATPAADAMDSTLADVDEDGDLDAIVYATDHELRVFQNRLIEDGAPGFASVPLWGSDPGPGTAPPFLAADSGVISVADVDGDRHVDLVLCAIPEFCQVWLGDGTGAFTRAWAPGSERYIYDVALTGAWPGL